MEKKKTSRANLENKKGIFLQIGFIAALAIVFLAFEWRTSEKIVSLTNVPVWDHVEELQPLNTVQPKPLPPPPAPIPVYTIKLVGNEDSVRDDFMIIDAGADPNWQVPDFIPLNDEPPDTTDNTLFLVVEENPEYRGGLRELYKFLQENLRYPEQAMETGITGTVYVGFVVEKDGSLSSITIQRSPHPLLSDEAIRVVSAMPPWKPGLQRGKPVRVSFSLPVKFSLL